MQNDSQNRSPKILVVYNESPDWPEADKQWTALTNRNLSAALTEKGYTFDTLKIYDSLDGLDAYDPREWLIWNWAEELAGKPWTDSVVAAEYGQRGFTYTGSPPEALAASCDRLSIKKKLSDAGLATLPAVVLSDPAQAYQWHTFPAIVKGAHQHGSFGIDNNSVVHSHEELARRIAYMRELLDDESIVEPFLDTREFHVSVMGNDDPYALPPSEYDYSVFESIQERLYMFRWKFDDESMGYKKIKAKALSPDVDVELQWKLRETAVGTYKVSGMRDYGRIDIRLKEGEPQVLDVNPNPDMDTTSALMTSAAAAGMAYADVIESIITYATARMPEPAFVR
jgi:D-alanine-D-alanine ligase